MTPTTVSTTPTRQLGQTAAKWLAALSLAVLSACGGGDVDTSNGGGGGTPSSATASACVNAAQLTTAGNTERLTMALRSGTDTATEVRESVVLGPATYNGQAVINTRITTTTTPASGPAVVDWSVLHDSISGATLLSHGSTTESSPGVATTRVTNTPAEAIRFDLKAGESSSQSVVTVLDGDAGTANTRALSWTFVGLEDVTVPAGTFRQACRFSSRETDTTGVSTDTFWLARDSGVLVKKDSSQTNQGQTLTTSLELLSATQNGQAVTP